MNQALRTAAILLLLATACGPGEDQRLRQAATRYGEAWASRDVDRIVELHTEDSTFRRHFEGQAKAVGKAEIRDQFSQILGFAIDYTSEKYDVSFGPDFVVIQYYVWSTPQSPVQFGHRKFTPDGSKYRMDAIDVIRFENGLVKSKQTFIDAEALYSHSRDVAAVASRRQ